ncbi:MAG: sugar ABC transporter permease [Oscillospiraceae bacterium]|nr:sugar ABC transporter permease [Oscillospiraceae bacterium]
MNSIQKALSGKMRQYGMVIALFVVVALFQVLTKGTLLMPLNISNIIQQNSYVMILACGMLLCILTGGNIDLSVGSVAGLIGAISAVFILRMGMPTPLAIFISLLIGLAIGCWHGFWIAYVGVPAFIATLAGLLIFRGLTMAILKGVSLAPMPLDYTFVAAGFLPDFAGPGGLQTIAIASAVIISAGLVAWQFMARKKRQSYGFDVPHIGMFIAQLAVVCAIIIFFTYRLAQHRGLPMSLVLVSVLVVVYSFITTRTVFGRNIYAFGGNATAARLSGINTKRVMFMVYANMGLLAALAGIIFTGRLNSATPKSGDGFELDAIAACFIGGASTTGGVGTVVGAIIGGLLMGVLNNGMSIMGVPIDWQQAVKGMVLLVAVAFDVLSKKRRSA